MDVRRSNRQETDKSGLGSAKIPNSPAGATYPLGDITERIIGRAIAVHRELKAVSAMTDQHVSQLMSTMKAARVKVGPLINFHEPRLIDGVRRVVF